MKYIISSLLILLSFATSTFAVTLNKGDIIHIESWPDIRYTRYVKIDDTGVLKIPYYNGEIQAEGKTIEEIDETIKSKFRYKFPTIKFITTFSGNASIKVSVVGAVFYPGEFVYPTGCRLSTIVKDIDLKKQSDNDRFSYISEYNTNVFDNNTDMSLRNETNSISGISKNSTNLNLSDRELNRYPKYDDLVTEKSFLYESVSYRNILIKRDTATISVDLLKFYNDGDLKNNPIILEGDVVVFSYIKKFVSIKGAVNFPNSYELKDNETLADIIAFAGGAVPTAYLKSVEISNPVAPKFRSLHYDSLKNYKARPSDHVYIRFNKKAENIKEIVLDGEIGTPGIYPIGDSTTLKQVIERAGGLSNKSDLLGIRITRRSDVNVGPFDDKVRNSYAKLRISDTDLNSKNLNIVLNDGDEVFIPEQSSVVHVAGYIGKPGSYEWVKGKTAEEYLNIAGGENRLAYNDLITVTNASTGKISMAKDVNEIGPGDLIYVPEFVPPTSRPGFVTFKEVVSVTAAILVAIISVIQINAALK